MNHNIIRKIVLKADIGVILRLFKSNKLASAIIGDIISDVNTSISKKVAIISNVKDANEGICIAAKMGYMDLLIYYEDQDLVDYDVPIKIAAFYGQPDVITYLMPKNILIDVNDVMYEASCSGQLDIIKLLVKKYGASDWRKGLVGAHRSGNMEVIQFFEKRKKQYKLGYRRDASRMFIGKPRRRSRYA